MAVAEAQIRVRIDDAPLRRLAERAAAPFKGVERQGVRAMRASVDRDFRSHGWHTPTGGFRRWARREAFGTKQPSTPPLRSVHRRWMGGAGSLEETSSTRLQIGARGPEVAAHAGGEGTNRSFRTTTIRPKKRTPSGDFVMRVFLAAEHGVAIRMETMLRGLKLPARPHGSATPELAADLERIVADRLVGA